MSTKIKLLFFLVLFSFCVSAQVKIGENPNIIDSASIVELESSNKALVLTRLTTAQMQAINPLNGAVVYNTDTQCVHYYNGLIWTNLCDGNSSSSFSFADNGNGTITLSDGNGNNVTFNGAAQTISTLADNGDGTYTYTNENGIETIISIVSTDNQNLQTDNTPGNISIDNGNAIAINVDDADADDQNEIQTLNYTSGVLTLSNDPNATTVDLSAFDQNAADDFSGSFNDLSDLPANLDTDATDDFNTGISFDGTNLTVSDAGGDVSTNISGLAYDDTAIRADVDQNTADIATNVTNIATNVTDIDNLEAEQTTQNTAIVTNTTNIATNATDIDNLEAEQTTQNTAIATNATDIAAHNAADGDLSATNEYNTGISFDGTDLTVTDLGGDQTIDISGLAYDDTAIRTDVDQNTADIATNVTNIATNVTDIDNLEAEQTSQNTAIATNASDIDNLEAEQTTQNTAIATNATDIAAHNAADGDLSDSNEYNTGISFDGTDLTVTDLGGDQTIDISGLAYDDTAIRTDVDQNTADIATNVTNIATNVTDIDNLEAEQTSQNTVITTNTTDIATNATDIDNLEAEQTTQNTAITTNATDIAAHNAADGDLSATNEYNTGISFDGTDLTVTDLGGDQTIDISGLAYDDTAIRTDVDQNTADIATNVTNIATNVTDIDNLEAEQTTQNTAIATNATDIAAHNAADGDLSATNEYNTGISFDGTDLTVTDLGGDQTIDISGLAYDDTAIRTDVDQNTADIATNVTNIATNVTDIDNLEAEQTTQNTAIATNATDIAAHNAADGDLSATNEYNTGISFDGTDLTVTDLGGDQTIDISGLAYDDTAIQADVDQNTADIATNVTNIATNVTDIDNLEAEQTTQNTAIATNATDIAAHNAADGDLSATNEYNTGISFDGTDLTVTDLGGDQTIDISGLAYDDTAIRADVDQNTADIATNVTNIATNVTDIDNLEAEQTTQNTAIATNASDIDNLEAEQTTQNTAIATNVTDIATNATDIDTLEAEQTTQNTAIATNATDIAAHNAADGDLSDSNEYNTGISFDGTDLTVTDLGGDQTIDISGLAYDDTAIRTDVDQNTADIATNVTNIATNVTDIDNLEAEQTTQNTAITTNATDIAAHNAADGDLSATNEYNTGISFDGTDLTVTDLGGDQTIDISGLAYDDTAIRAVVDQNTADIATNVTNIATNVTDIDNLEAEQTTQNTAIATNASDIDNLEAEQTTQNTAIDTNVTDIATNATDIDTLEAEQTTQNTAIATNATDIAAHNAADGDLSATNEYNTGISFDGTDLTVTDLGGDQTIDISGLAYDDTAIQADVDQNTADIATNVTNIATNVTGIDNLEAEQTTQNTAIATNATDIAAHNAADGDLSATNEYNTGISFDGTDLTVTDLGGDQTIDISGLAYDDTAIRTDVDQNTADIATNVTNIATNVTDIDNLEAEQTTQNTAIATNATDIAAHNAADGDLSDSNEYNTGISFDGTDLTVTDLGGDQTIDISGLAYDDTAIRTDVDQNTADIATNVTNIATNVTDIDNLEAEQTSQNTAIATNASDIDNLEAEQTTQNTAITTNATDIAAHNAADGDLSATNEYNTGISFDGTDLTVTDLGGDQTIDISGLAYDDTAIRTDVDQNTADIATNVTNIATNVTDIDNLEAEQTTQNTAIATNASDIDNLEAEQTTQNTAIATNVTDIATNATDIDNLEAEQTTQNTAIATNATDIAAHNAADGDLSATNEYNTGISFDGTDLTVTDLGGDQTIDISGLAYDDTAIRTDVDQNTADIATNVTNIDNLEAEQTTQNTAITTNTTDIATNATDIDNLEAEQTTQNTAIATNATNIAAHNAADGDLSATNEYNTGISFDGTDLTVTDLGGDQTIDISGLAYDDTAIRADVDQNTADIATNVTNIATNVTDIDNLEAEQTTQNTAIATNASDIDNLEAEQTTQNTAIATNVTDIATNATDIDTLEAEQTTQNTAIAANTTNITAVDNKVDAHILADEDVSATNELSDLSLSATNILTLTNPATGTNQVDLSTVSTDDQTVEMFAFNGSTFELLLKIEDDPTTQVANLSSLYADGTETEITAGTGIQILGDGSSSLPYTITNVFTEIDGSVTNETNTSFSTVDVAGTDYLRISDSNGDLDVPLSDLSHTGTTGSIFFADTAGTPTENNGQLFWDNTNNRLSIGNPLAGTNKLTVNGATRTSGLNNSDGTLSLPSYRFSDDSDTGTYSPAADEIGLVVGGIEALKVEETSNKTSVIINETLELEGTVLDKNDSAGTAGQVLSSTATGTEWVDNYNPVKAIGKISSTGTVTKATAGVTVARISVGYYRVTLPAGSVSDADYIIQLSQPGRNGVGNDDPGISYSNQTATSFEVIIGDNDNGGTDRSRFDSEFMFTILDL